MMSFPKQLAARLEAVFAKPRIDADDSSAQDGHSASSTDTRRTHSNNSRPRISRRADPIEVAATLPMLETLAKHLRDTASDMQNAVVAISSGFGGMAASARETVQIAQGGLNSQEGTNTDQTIFEIRTVLTSLLSAVQDSSQLSSRLSDRIGELEQVLNGVNTSLRKVEKIAEEARIVGLNGRLEAARAGQHGSAFNVVANETKNLGVHAAETSTSIRKLVDQLDVSLKTVSQDLRSRMVLDAETASQSQQTVSRLLDQLGIMHHGMTDSLHRTQSASESLSREIGKSVMALQFQDRVNQRIDHVVEALEAIHENLSPYRAEVPAGRAESRAADWRQWLESKSTMQSERDLIFSRNDTATSGDSGDCGSVELF